MYDREHPDGHKELLLTNDKEQTEAFETLESLCESEEIVTHIGSLKETKEKPVSRVSGPRRIEVSLRVILTGQEIKLVVTDVMAPAGHYRDYSVTGRKWRILHNELDKSTTVAWGLGYNITKLETFLGGGGSTVQSFTSGGQENAWSTLKRLFDDFRPVEIVILKNWDVNPTDDLVDFGGGYGEAWTGDTHRTQHWTNHTPVNYAPQKAYYRVAGDEVGAVIHREQKEVWENEGSLNPAESLEEILKSKSNKSVTNPPKVETSPDLCTGCGGVNCNPGYCNEDIDLAMFGGGVINGGHRIN